MNGRPGEAAAVLEPPEDLHQAQGIGDGIEPAVGFPAPHIRLVRNLMSAAANPDEAHSAP